MGEEVKENTLQTIMEEYLALKKLVIENNLDALTVKCQYELSREYGVAPCIPLSLIAEDIPTSCEGDVPLIISQLILYYLTGKVTTYGDVHDVLSVISEIFVHYKIHLRINKQRSRDECNCEAIPSDCT